jgi:hypothetical protein
MRNTSESKSRPWGVMTAVIMGAITTLACVVRGFEPLLVLERVCIASIAAGIVGALTSKSIRAIVAPAEVRNRAQHHRGQHRGQHRAHHDEQYSGGQRP